MSPATPPGPSCGVNAGSVTAIRDAVAKDARFHRDGGKAARIAYSSEALQAIWTFTTSADPAYPAAVCEQVVDSEGAMRIQRRIYCEAAPAACERLAAEISQRDEGSGDIE